MEEFYVDIHCHPTMRAINTSPNGKERNMWESTKNDLVDTFIGKWAWEQSKGVSKFSQSNFYNCINGKTRVVFDSFYPLERGFINFKKVPQTLVGKKTLETLAITASGISVEQMRKYRDQHDYFNELNEQYAFLAKNQGPSPCGKYNYRVAKNYQDLENSLKNDPNMINVIVTVEGAHAFGCGRPTTEHLPLNELKQLLKSNIEAVKKWEHPPFFITFAHHFWNQLCGHAMTLPVPTTIACTQKKGLDIAFTELGSFVLDELLSTKNGKRILIDTRHMSVNSRKHYINYVSEHNKKHPNDLIPIISSHSAVNGFETMEHSLQVKDSISKKKSTAFCAWSLNISAEEAIAIHDSGGVAGVILDKGRHSGVKLLKSIEKIQNIDEKKEQFLKLICNNIFFYIRAVNKKTGWDILTIGSDFDGVITHFDIYEDVSKLPELKKDLINFLTKNKYHSELWFGYTPEEMIHKLFTQNAMDFLKRNFK
jgi:microsomal dipeptidase-like Zn-dependent dipeptidase